MKTGRELAMLQEVITWFGENPIERRAIYSNSLNMTICSYSKITEKKECIGCAIGMYIPNKTAKIFDNIKGGSRIDIVIDNPLTNKLLPKWMKEMSIDFLMHLQNLHDTDHNWDLEKNKGLTKEGVLQVEHICNLENIPFNKLKINKFYKK